MEANSSDIERVRHTIRLLYGGFLVFLILNISGIANTVLRYIWTDTTPSPAGFPLPRKGAYGIANTVLRYTWTDTTPSPAGFPLPRKGAYGMANTVRRYSWVGTWPGFAVWAVLMKCHKGFF